MGVGGGGVACDSGHSQVNRLGWWDKPEEGSRSGLKSSDEPDRGCEDRTPRSERKRTTYFQRS